MPFIVLQQQLHLGKTMPVFPWIFISCFCIFFLSLPLLSSFLLPFFFFFFSFFSFSFICFSFLLPSSRFFFFLLFFSFLVLLLFSQVYAQFIGVTKLSKIDQLPVWSVSPHDKPFQNQLSRMVENWLGSSETRLEPKTNVDRLMITSIRKIVCTRIVGPVMKTSNGYWNIKILDGWRNGSKLLVSWIFSIIAWSVRLALWQVNCLVLFLWFNTLLV